MLDIIFCSLNWVRHHRRLTEFGDVCRLLWLGKFESKLISSFFKNDRMDSYEVFTLAQLKV